MNKSSMVVTSYVFVGIYGVDRNLLTRDALINLSDMSYRAIDMEILGKKKVGSLKSLDPNCRVKSFSVSQMLKTSILSIDSWPEKDAFTVLVHSCKKFDGERINEVVMSLFEGAVLLHNSYEDHSIKALLSNVA